MDNTLEKFSSLAQEFENQLPPVHLWNPDLNGDLDMRIDREGHWYYQGSRILRQPLIKLFSSILKKEGGDYYLVTPTEKWRISVDVAPLHIVSLRKVEDLLVFTTNVGNEFTADKSHPIFVDKDKDGNPLPLITAQRGLDALISRSVFYQLVENADVISESGKDLMIVSSAGEHFILGQC